MSTKTDTLADALEWALKNLEEVALPIAERHGYVTSLPSAIERGRAALLAAGITLEETDGTP